MPTSPIQLNTLEKSAAGRALAAVGQYEKTLESFTDFTSSLVENVFKVVIDSTLNQLDAYAELVASVSGSLADYEGRLLGNTQSQEQKGLAYLNEVVMPQFWPNVTLPLQMQHITLTNVYTVDPTKVSALRALFAGSEAPVKVTELLDNSQAKADDSTYEKPQSPPEEASVAFEEVLIVDNVTTPTVWTIKAKHLHAFALAKLKREVKASYDKLITVLKLGMQKVVVTHGEISTSITLHADSTDSDSLDSSNVETESDIRSKGFTASLSGGGERSRKSNLSGNIIARSLGGSINATGGMSRVRSKLKVNVVNEQKEAITNLSVDITGKVIIRFRTESFPAYDPTNPLAPASA